MEYLDGWKRGKGKGGGEGEQLTAEAMRLGGR
jgi:hypothetical protein